MPNDRYIPKLGLFDTLDFYESPSVAAFNPAGAFGAFALVSIRGEWQDAEVGVNPDSPQFIWGNLDTQGAGGWGFMLTNTGQVPEVSAFVGVTTPDNVQVIHPLDSSGPPVQWADRVMLLELWVDGISLYFCINGTIIGVAPLGDPYLASAFAPRVGQDPNNAVDTAFTVGHVHAVGYTNSFFPLTVIPQPADTTVGFLAASSWRAVMEDLRGTFILKEAQGDWDHRYNVSALSPDPLPLITKSPQGAIIASGSLPAASWPDEGNQNFLQPPPAITPVDLVRNTNPAGASLQCDQLKNPEFYHGGIFTFIAPA